MDEYIKREAALNLFSGEPLRIHYPDWYAEKIKTLSAADVAPVIRATWVLTTDFGLSELYHCSRCGREEVRFGKSSIYKQYPYCHCGAKMDEGAE